MIKHITAMLIIMLLSLSAPALAAEQSNGSVEGQIINGTVDGSSVADQDITLKTYLNDAEVDSTGTRTDDDGRFLFNGLSTDSGYSYEVTLVYKDAEYYSGELIFNEGEITKPVEIIVYDSTTSDEAIKVTMAHTIVYVEQDGLMVMEYFIFANESDRTYIGPEQMGTADTRETLRFSLPKEATELQNTLGLMDCCIVGTEDGFVDTMAVLPGFKEVAYSYKVYHNAGTYTLTLNMNYPTFRYDLLFQGDAIKVARGDLAAGETMSIEGIQFEHLFGSDISAGDILEVQLSGLPNANNQQAIMWVASVLVVFTIGFGFIYFVRKRKLQPVIPEESLDQKKQRLFLELAQLDDDFQAGKIGGDNYHSLRAIKKSQLVELLQSQKRGMTTESDGE